MNLRAPRPLQPGSLVAVVAPAGPFDREYVLRGLAWLRTRYRLRLTSSILERTGYLAGDDARRSAELGRAMTDDEVHAIVCARGGYGTMRIVDALPWEAFAARPKWITGFSDITALHTIANGLGICTLHAPNLTGLGKGITPAERLSFLSGLEGLPAAPWSDLEIMHAGARGTVVTGPLVGGNLALLASMAAAGRLTVPEGAILALEDVTERPYRIDRMLTALKLGGHLARASAIIFGDFTECDPAPDGVTTPEVLRERTSALGIPVVARAPFGHATPNRAFVLGAPTRLTNRTLTFDR